MEWISLSIIFARRRDISTIDMGIRQDKIFSDIIQWNKKKGEEELYLQTKMLTYLQTDFLILIIPSIKVKRKSI